MSQEYKENNEIEKEPDTDHITKIMNFILSSQMHPYEKDKYFRMKFPKFAKAMPTLFDKLISNNMKKEDFDQINMMLDMRRKVVDNKNIPVIDADKIVYGDLRKKYIDPKIQLDHEKLEEYMNKKEYTEDELNAGPQIKYDVKN